MRSLRFNIYRNRVVIPAIFAIVVAFMCPQLVSAQASPEATLTAFYKWYLHELSLERYPRPTAPRVNSAISERLRRWFKSAEGREWDADYFIDAQDWDPKWATNIATSKAVIRGKRADVRVILGTKTKEVNGMGRQTLRIKMVKEGKGWKIDRINGY